MTEIMDNIDYLKEVVNEYKLRELSKPLDPHDFKRYKTYKKRLAELEERANKINDRKSVSNKSSYPLDNVDYIHMSSKAKKYLFC